MSVRLYVGNLAFSSTEDSIRSLFDRNGIEVLSVQLMTDRMTGQSRGFGFVEVAGEREAEAAINALHGANLDGRNLTVNEARERPPQRVRGRGGDDDQRRGRHIQALRDRKQQPENPEQTGESNPKKSRGNINRW